MEPFFVNTISLNVWYASVLLKKSRVLMWALWYSGRNWFKVSCYNQSKLMTILLCILWRNCGRIFKWGHGCVFWYIATNVIQLYKYTKYQVFYIFHFFEDQKIISFLWNFHKINLSIKWYCCVMESTIVKHHQYCKTLYGNQLWRATLISLSLISII